MSSCSAARAPSSPTRRSTRCSPISNAARVVGKPAAAFFAAARHAAGVPAEQAVMVGDDLEADVLGAQAHGVSGVLVRTGKYQESDEAGAHGRRPHRVLDSVADLPALL